MALAGIAVGKPSSMDPKAWFHLAIQMDQNCAADEAFQASCLQAHVPAPTILSSRPAPTAPSAHPDLCFDIQHMDVNELEMVLKYRLTARDMLLSEYSTESKPTSTARGLCALQQVSCAPHW